MKILYCILYIVAIFLCVIGFMGHTAAWSAAALAFFAATMIVIKKRNKL